MDTRYVAQAWRGEAAIARAADEGRAVTRREPQNLSAGVGLSQAVVVHSAKMRHHNPPGLATLHWRSGLIDDLSKDVPLGEMKVPRESRTRNREEANLRGTVEVADGFDALLPHQYPIFVSEGPARSDPPPDASTREQIRVLGKKINETDRFATRSARWKNQRVEIEQFHLSGGGEQLLRVMATVVDDTAQSSERRVVDDTGHMRLAVSVEDDRSFHRRLSNEHARRGSRQGSPIALAPEVDRGPAAGPARPATQQQVRGPFIREQHGRSHGTQLLFRQDRDTSQIGHGFDPGLIDLEHREPFAPKRNRGAHEGDLSA